MIGLLIALVLVLLFALLSWVLKAASTGQIKRGSRWGLRTEAMNHCDDCWLLGHHAAAQKGILGCFAAAMLIAAGALISLFVPASGILYVLALVLGLGIVLTGVLLGLRDARIMLAKMHAGSSSKSAD